MGASWKRKFAWGESNFAWGLLGVASKFLGETAFSDYIILSCVALTYPNKAHLFAKPAPLITGSLRIPWGLLGVCLGCDEPMLGDVRFTMFAWGFDTFLLGDEFFERCAWGCGFQGLVCLGTSISAPLLLGDLLGVDLLGSVRQGCSQCCLHLII